jgi:hypothetical protein
VTAKWSRVVFQTNGTRRVFAVSPWQPLLDRYGNFLSSFSKRTSLFVKTVPLMQSNHESGRAIDTSYYNYWEGTLAAYGWTHTYPSSDPVHFDYSGSPDISQETLKAFQLLWNQHNPGNQLDTDGIYGPATESALYNTPCGGW